LVIGDSRFVIRDSVTSPFTIWSFGREASLFDSSRSLSRRDEYPSQLVRFAKEILHCCCGHDACIAQKFEPERRFIGLLDGDS